MVHSNGGGGVDYGDRAVADKGLLTYTSSPLNRDVEITGHPVINLKISSSESDGAVIAYLEDVAPGGKVTMLTRGQLRLIHRKNSSEKPPYPIFGPYHTFEDASPMRRGEVAEVSFGLLPLSVKVKKGHALRVAISGHDKVMLKGFLRMEYKDTHFTEAPMLCDLLIFL